MDGGAGGAGRRHPVDEGHGTNGIYRAAIGRVTLLNGTPIGREMGASTWVVFAGSNQNAGVQGEIVVTVDELQRVLKARNVPSLSRAVESILASHQAARQ